MTEPPRQPLRQSHVCQFCRKVYPVPSLAEDCELRCLEEESA